MTESSINIKKTVKVPRLGNLLVSSEILKPEILEEGVEVAKQAKQPLGRILLMLGYIGEKDLEGALLAQSSIEQNLLTPEQCIKALRLGFRKTISFTEALEELGIAPVNPVAICYLGRLLIGSGFINMKLYQEAINSTTKDSETSLGRFLLLRGAISPSALILALEALIFVQEGFVELEEAVQGLAYARLERTSLEEAFLGMGFYPPSKPSPVIIGELFAASGLITDSDRINALEQKLHAQDSLGKMLLDSGLISANLLSEATKLQEMVMQGLVNKEQACEVLRQIQSQGISLQQAIEELELFKEDPHTSEALLALLQKAGLVSEHDIKLCQSTSSEYALGTCKALLRAKLINKQVYEAALQCQSLITEDALKLEQAIIALQVCDRTRSNLRDALESLSIEIDQDTLSKNGLSKKIENIKRTGNQTISGPLSLRDGKPEETITYSKPKFSLPGNSSQVRQVIWLAALFLSLTALVFFYLPAVYQPYTYWLLLVFLSLSLFSLSHKWNEQKEREKEERLIRIQAAQDIHGRISRARTLV